MDDPDKMPGGNGGDGGVVNLLFSSPVAAALEQAGLMYKASNDQSKSWPGAFEDGTKYLVDLVSMQIHRDDNSLKYLQESLRKLTETLKLQLSDYQQALIEVLTNLVDVNRNLASLFSQTIITKGGAWGVGYNAKNGSSGQKAKFSVACTWGNKSVWDSSVCFIHPIQCRMLLDKAKIFFFVDTAVTRARSTEILQMLQRRLAFLDHAHKSQDKSNHLADAYRAAEERLFLPPTAKGKELATFEILRHIKAETAATLSQLYAGRDIYNRDRFYVPRRSYLACKGTASEILRHLKDSETAYWEYVAAVNKSESTQAHIKSGAKACLAAKTYNSARREATYADLDDSASKIKTLSAMMTTAHDDVMARVHEVESHIRNLFKIPFDSIVNAMGQILMVRGNPMVALQGASILQQAQTTIPDDNNGRINKDYLIHKVHNITGTIDSVNEGYKLSQGGTINLLDPGADKLQISEKDLNKLLDSYWATLGSAGMEAVKKAFQNYIAITLQRNAAVQTYNAAVALLAKYSAEDDATDATMHSLSQMEVDNLHPDLPLMTVVMKKLYVDMLLTTQEYLYEAQRAYNFAALDSANILGDVLHDAPVSQYNHAVLTAADVALTDAYARFQNRAGMAPQPFHTIRHQLAPAQVDAIKSSKTRGKILKVRLSPPGTGNSKPPDDDDEDAPFLANLQRGNEATEFAGMADVRITHVRFFLDGAVTTSGFLRSTLIHLGEETLTDQHGRNILFTHDALEVGFKYELKTRSYQGDNTLPGVIGLGSRDDGYALVGPFATWEIRIDRDPNSGLDLSDVKAAYMEFEGEYRAV